MKGDVDGYRPILLGMYVSAAPFLIALSQTLKILNYINNERTFSVLTVKALKYVKYCALAISALYIAELPYIYIRADQDDAPGLLALGLIIIGTSFVIATSAAVLRSVLQSAIEIKAENDLTV